MWHKNWQQWGQASVTAPSPTSWVIPHLPCPQCHTTQGVVPSLTFPSLSEWAFFLLCPVPSWLLLLPLIAGMPTQRNRNAMQNQQQWGWASITAIPITMPPAPTLPMYTTCTCPHSTWMSCFLVGSKYVSPFFHCYLRTPLIYFHFHALFQDHLQQYLFQQVLVYHWPSIFTLWKINQMEWAVCPPTWSGSSMSIPQCCMISNIIFHIWFQTSQPPLSYTVPTTAPLL